MPSILEKGIHHLRNGTGPWVARNLLRSAVRKLDWWGHVLKRDAGNRWTYGREAPKYGERIWVDPRPVDRLVTNEVIQAATGMHRNRASGLVIDWGRISESLPLMEQPKMQYCLRHWRDGLSWEDLGYYDYMATTHRHRNWSRQQIVDRFRELDEVFEETRRTGRLKTRAQLDARAFREEGGILMHIGPGGAAFFGGNGFHRLAMAKALNLSRIPACLGVVDRAAIPRLKGYRSHA